MFLSKYIFLPYCRRIVLFFITQFTRVPYGNKRGLAKAKRNDRKGTDDDLLKRDQSSKCAFSHGFSIMYAFVKTLYATILNFAFCTTLYTTLHFTLYRALLSYKHPFVPEDRFLNYPLKTLYTTLCTLHLHYTLRFTLHFALHFALALYTTLHLLYPRSLFEFPAQKAYFAISSYLYIKITCLNFPLKIHFDISS